MVNYDFLSVYLYSVPNLRFLKFNQNYETLQLKNTLKIKSGKDQKQVEVENGIYNIYGTGGIIGHTNTFLYDKESVGIGRKGTIDKPVYFDQPFWTVDTLFYSEIYEGFIPKYIFYLFQTINWKKYNTSTGVPSLTSSSIENIEKSFPCYDEQLKVANFLTMIDMRIETQIKIIDTLSSQKKQIRNLIFKDIHKNVNCCIQDYVVYEQPQKYIVHSTDYLSYGKDYIPVLTANQSFILGYTLEKDGIYEKGDCILFDDFTNENKYVDFPFKVKSSALKILQTKEGLMLKFFYEYLQFLKFESTDHKRHYLSEVAVTDINVPNLKEQTFVCKVFNSFDSKLKNEEALLEKYRLQKQFLLNNLFI